MKLNPKFFDYVRSLNPDVDFRRDVIVSVDGDGEATIEWNLPGQPPSDKEINAAVIPVFVPKKSVEQRLSELETKVATKETL